MTLSRRGLLGAFLAAPAIIRTPGLLMPVKQIVPAQIQAGMLVSGFGIAPNSAVTAIVTVHFPRHLLGGDDLSAFFEASPEESRAAWEFFTP